MAKHDVTWEKAIVETGWENEDWVEIYMIQYGLKVEKPLLRKP